MRSTVLNLAGIICGLVLAPAANAGDHGRNPHKSNAPANAETSSPGSAQAGNQFAFSIAEKRGVQEYVDGYGAGKHARRLPPGLAKKQARGRQLPPGWQTKCVPGEVMPPEVYQESYPLPPELVVKLPPPPQDTITVTVSGKVVRLLQATREILDVFDVHI